MMQYIKFLYLIYGNSRNYARTHFNYKITICFYIPSFATAISATAKDAEKSAESEKIRQDPKTCQILVGQEVTIEFQKEKDQVIGIFIAGGSDTLWVSIFDNL